MLYCGFVKLIFYWLPQTEHMFFLPSFYLEQASTWQKRVVPCRGLRSFGRISNVTLPCNNVVNTRHILTPDRGSFNVSWMRPPSPDCGSAHPSLHPLTSLNLSIYHSGETWKSPNFPPSPSRYRLLRVPHMVQILVGTRGTMASHYSVA